MFLQEDQEIFPSAVAKVPFSLICFECDPRIWRHCHCSWTLFWVIKGLIKVFNWFRMHCICKTGTFDSYMEKILLGSSHMGIPPISLPLFTDPSLSAELVGVAAFMAERTQWAHAFLLWQLSICATNGTFIEGQQWQLGSINPEAHRGLSKPQCVYGSHQLLEQLNYVWVL